MYGPINSIATVVPKSHAPAANTAAIITLAATANVRHVVDQVFGGYDAAPTGGSIKIEATVDGDTVTMEAAITSAGLFVLPMERPLQGDDNTAITITLAAAGAAVTGKVNALTR